MDFPITFLVQGLRINSLSSSHFFNISDGFNKAIY